MRNLRTGLPLLIVLILAPAATAGAAVGDGTYLGEFKKDPTAKVELTVFDNGQSIDGFFDDVLYKCSDGSKTREDLTFSGVGIRKHKFFLKLSNPIRIEGEFDGERVTGIFFHKFDAGGGITCKTPQTEWKARLD